MVLPPLILFFPRFWLLAFPFPLPLPILRVLLSVGLCHPIPSPSVRISAPLTNPPSPVPPPLGDSIHREIRHLRPLYPPPSFMVTAHSAPSFFPYPHTQIRRCPPAARTGSGFGFFISIPLPLSNPLPGEANSHLDLPHRPNAWFHSLTRLPHAQLGFRPDNPLSSVRASILFSHRPLQK